MTVDNYSAPESVSKPYTASPGLFGSLEEDYQQQFITSEEGLIRSRERSQKLNRWGRTAKFGSAGEAPRSAAGARKAFQGPRSPAVMLRELL